MCVNLIINYLVSHNTMLVAHFAQFHSCKNGSVGLSYWYHSCVSNQCKFVQELFIIKPSVADGGDFSFLEVFFFGIEGRWGRNRELCKG